MVSLTTIVLVSMWYKVGERLHSNQSIPNKTSAASLGTSSLSKSIALASSPAECHEWYHEHCTKCYIKCSIAAETFFFWGGGGGEVKYFPVALVTQNSHHKLCIISGS